MGTAASIAERADGRLVEAHLAGDRRAFETLYRRYRERLVSFCRKQCGDRMLAEDLAQETMIRYLDTAETFEASRPMWPWLRTIARNLVIDQHRRVDEYLDLDADDVTVTDESQDAVIRIDRIEQQSHLGPMLDQLPDRQRTALELRYIQDWDRVEVADYLGIKINACDQLLHRARRNAREYYENLPRRSAGRRDVCRGTPRPRAVSA